MSSPETGIDWPIYDPYVGCEDRCNHELVPAVLVSDLLRDEGPYLPWYPLLRPAAYTAE